MAGNSIYRQPQYLGASHEPVHRVRCAVHGFIRYSQSERRVIDHPIFRRLRYIRQLALTELVYPGATHTRFEHSLGVMEMSARIFDRLAAENGAQMEETFAEVDVLRYETMARARQVCRLAALLHDTGHCCFSHAAEPVIHEGSNHEALTVYLLETPELMGRHLDTEYFEGCAKLAASLIKPKTAPAPQVQMLRDIVSGQVDADRSDYLLRDSHHCGVDYGRFDHRRLIECLTGWRDDDTGELVVGIKRDGIHSFESLILARYQMNTQVYYHRLRRIYDIYLERYFRSLDKAEFESAEKILSWNDIKALPCCASKASLIRNRSSLNSPSMFNSRRQKRRRWSRMGDTHFRSRPRTMMNCAPSTPGRRRCSSSCFSPRMPRGGWHTMRNALSLGAAPIGSASAGPPRRTRIRRRSTFQEPTCCR